MWTDDPRIREYFRKVVGDEGLRILEKVPEGEITDSELAKLNDTKPTSVRKVLYKLYERRIAEYRTERDDTSGWITYWWRFNRDNLEKIMEKEADDELKQLSTRLDYERNGEFFQCQCQCVLFEEAAEKDFWCEECDSKFEYLDNGALIKELEDLIEERRAIRRRTD